MARPFLHTDVEFARRALKFRWVYLFFWLKNIVFFSFFGQKFVFWSATNQYTINTKYYKPGRKHDMEITCQKSRLQNCMHSRDNEATQKAYAAKRYEAYIQYP